MVVVERDGIRILCIGMLPFKEEPKEHFALNPSYDYVCVAYGTSHSFKDLKVAIEAYHDVETNTWHTVCALTNGWKTTPLPPR